MKFLGVELSGYACFERQFVRLQRGLNLLVGKNNSGKTAILRALPLLRGALSQPQFPLEVALGPYARSRDHLDFATLFEVEPRDESIFDASRGFDWNGLVMAKRPLATCHFRFWSESAILALKAFEITIPGWGNPLSVIEATSEGVFRSWYRAPLNILEVPQDLTRSRKTIQAAGGPATPDRTTAYGRILGMSWGEALDQLHNVEFIAPHRVAAASLPLATTPKLATDAENLATYLQTLQVNQRKQFQAIEDFIVSSFSEFQRVNAVSQGNQAAITVTRRGTEEDVPLAYCGTGVEQLLALTAVITASEPNQIILMDEPHSYLHPAAERALLRFLEQFSDRYFVIATHSAVLINGVTPDRLTYLESPGTPYESALLPAASSILHDLGYRNSDALFFDRLVIVEGSSDTEILRRLLDLSGHVRADVLQNTGFPCIGGADERARDIQTKVLQFEKLLEAVGRAKMPRSYLMDGDREPDDLRLLGGTTNPTTREPVKIRFLPRTEIENYLLVPEAIAHALHEEASLAGVDAQDIAVDAVRARFDELLAMEDGDLFPRGRVSPMEQVKGSKLLERLYDHFEHLRYDKKRSGLVIAKHLTPQNAIGLDEIVGLLDVLGPV